MARATTKPKASCPEIEYPDSDGKPIGETGIHVEVILGLLSMLRSYYHGNPDVAVLANMFLYYVEGDPSKNVTPDVFVTKGVPSDTTRHTFKVWKEGKCPDLVIEVTSKQTRREDKNKKMPLYLDVLKVGEYFLFDPDQEYLEPSLQGYRLVSGQYVPIAPRAGRLPSKVLGLHLERDSLDLRLYDPRTGRWIPNWMELERLLEESKAARRREDAAGRRELAARRREESALREVEMEIVRLRREINPLRKKMAEGS